MNIALLNAKLTHPLTFSLKFFLYEISLKFTFGKFYPREELKKLSEENNGWQNVHNVKKVRTSEKMLYPRVLSTKISLKLFIHEIRPEHEIISCRRLI